MGVPCHPLAWCQEENKLLTRAQRESMKLILPCKPGSMDGQLAAGCLAVAHLSHENALYLKWALLSESPVWVAYSWLHPILSLCLVSCVLNTVYFRPAQRSWSSWGQTYVSEGSERQQKSKSAFTRWDVISLPLGWWDHIWELLLSNKSNLHFGAWQ